VPAWPCVAVEANRFMGAFSAPSPGTLGEVLTWPSDESQRKIIAYGWINISRSRRVKDAGFELLFRSDEPREAWRGAAPVSRHADSGGEPANVIRSSRLCENTV
jgi:hypothetical protein